MKNILKHISGLAESLPSRNAKALWVIVGYLNCETGIATGFTSSDIEKAFHLDRRSGRKVEDAVTKTTVRSILKTIEKSSNGAIQITSKNQKYIVTFTEFMSQRLNGNCGSSSAFNSKESTVVSSSEKAITLNTKGMASSERVEIDTQKNTVQNIPAYINKNKIINNKKNKYKLSQKISASFLPNAETIEQAQNENLDLLINQNEINRFINWNLDRGFEYSQDVWQSKFIEWLRKTASFQASNAALEPISLDFTPSEATIQQALESGLIDVLDQAEINRFIDWNTQRKNSHTTEVWQQKFIEWLSKTAQFKQSNEYKGKGSHGHATSPISSLTTKTVVINAQQAGRPSINAFQFTQVPSSNGVADAAFFDI